MTRGGRPSRADIQTEAYLRRTHPRDTDRPDRIVPTLVGASLALWTGLLIAAL